MRKIALLSLWAILGFSLINTSGCVYRSSIVQGNDIDKRAIDRLENGMTREQVRALLGAPLIQDRYHPNRWDYVFYTVNLPSSTDPVRVSIFFDTVGQIEKIERSGI